MVNQILLYLGAALSLLWGIAHLFPAKSVVSDFGNISIDNRHIITMEWIIEGVALIFIGVLVLVVTFIDYGNSISTTVYLLSSGALVILALVSLFTGFKVSFLPFKLCPLIFTSAAVLILAGSFI